jgi:acyl dehydratase
VALLTTLARGAVAGIGKKPSARAPLPDVRLTAADVRIEPARLARYAEVCGYSPGAAVPLTYPHVLGFPLAARLMAARDFPLPLAGLVHTSVEITARRPPALADLLELTVYADELMPHRRGTEVAVITEVRVVGADGGAPAWTDRSTYLARHAVPDAPRPAPGGEPDALPAVEEWRLPAGLGRRHARVSGDYNPIHLHPWTARPFGFPRAIAHGMWTVARCAAALGSPRYLAAEFRAPIPLPSTVTFAATALRFQVRSPTAVHLTGTIEG